MHWIGFWYIVFWVLMFSAISFFVFGWSAPADLLHQLWIRL
jgi:hypothetical protein